MYGNNYYTDHNLSVAYISERMRDVEEEAAMRRLLKSARVITDAQKTTHHERFFHKLGEYTRMVLAALHISRWSHQH